MTTYDDDRARVLPSSEDSQEQTKVSFVVPVYAKGDAELKYLEQCLDSVLAVADTSVEIQVVDDGSPADVAQIVARYAPAVRYAREENQGAATARNTGLSLTTGEYVKFLDSDDLLLSAESLAEMVALLDDHPEVGLVYAQALKVDAQDRVFGIHPRGQGPSYIQSGEDEVRALLTRWAYMLPTAAIVRRSVLERAGPFHPEIKIGEDWDLWIRVANTAAVAYLDHPVAVYRVHGSSQTTAARRAVPWLGYHLNVLDSLLSDSAFAQQYAKECRIARAQLLAKAVKWAGEDGAPGLAWLFAGQSVWYSLATRQARGIGWTIWFLAAYGIAGRLVRLLATPWRRARAAAFALRMLAVDAPAAHSDLAKQTGSSQTFG